MSEQEQPVERASVEPAAQPTLANARPADRVNSPSTTIGIGTGLGLGCLVLIILLVVFGFVARSVGWL